MSRKLNLKSQASLFFNLSMLMEAGLPLARALQLLSVRRSFSYLKEVDDYLQQGSSFSSALAKQITNLSPFVVGVLRVGEGGGSLEESVSRIALYLEETQAFKTKLFHLLCYPVFILLLCGGSLVFTLIFILPSFMQIFSGLDLSLPLLTRCLLGLGIFLRFYFGYVFVFCILVVLVLAKLIERNLRSRLLKEQLVLALPIYGDLSRKLVWGRLFTAWGFLLKSGLSFLQSIEICQGLLTGLVYKEVFRRVAEKAEAGQALSNSLRAEKLVETEAVEMIAVGEESGRLAEILCKVGRWYEVEAENRIKFLVSLAEPAATLLVGAVVGLLALAVFLPLLGMLSGL